ncbi:MAG TPA: prolyl oligopeptidase family serine peptidase [Terriglobia bacterium]|jgi:prolyl oligopeptidase|nr:prolyl oligopeptidase family serine peptidase [Terriglobia bacterium]
MLFLTVGASLLAGANSTSTLPPPPTRRDDVLDDYHGVKVPDPYRWLEDQNSPETRAWVKVQDDHTRSTLDSLPGRDVIRQRLSALMNVDVIGVPREEAGRYFFSRRKVGQDLPVLYVRQGLEGDDRVLLDPHPLSPDHTTSVTLQDVSKDGRLIAYGVRLGGKDEESIHLKDVDSGKDLADVLPEARYAGVTLKADKTGLYYGRQLSSGPRLFYHALGTDPAKDQQIFGDGLGPGDIAFPRLSDDGRYLLIEVSHGAAAVKTELYLQDLVAGTPIRPVVNDINSRFSGDLAGDRLYIQTNWQAPNSRVLVTDLSTPTRDHWREVVPQSDAAIEGISAAAGRLFVNYTRDAHSVVKVFGPDGSNGREIPLPTLGTASVVAGRWESPNAFFNFSSFADAGTIYRYDPGQGAPEVWAHVETPVQSDSLAVRQVWYASKDGTRVPMFVVLRKDAKLDGSNPTLMTGYGGFDLSMTPGFSAEAVAWVESGGVFALPNLRGGGEFGEKWHHAGMLADKQNVFDDFEAAAQWLIDNRYTSPAKLAITGQSNGGLLVGAALTQRPDLFRAVVCRYPLLDMLRYQDFLVARFWVPEYGEATNPDEFKYIAAYSPYQNVKQGTKYPAVLFVTGDGDTRVAPLHARKMAAMMQWATSAGQNAGRPILLSYDTKSGHLGGRPLSKQIDELTDELSFFTWQLGM